MKKLIPALALLVVSAVLMGTSTFAWFSLNNKVNVTGMQVHTKVGDSLQIAATNSEEEFNNGLHQAVTGLLEPVSTVNAVNFFYNSTSNVDAAGDAKGDHYITYAAGNDFDTNYGVNTTGGNDALGYVDYAFYLKATNTAATTQKVYMSRCNLLYNGSALAAKDKAWRVAMFVQSASKNTEQDAALVSTDVVTIMTVFGANENNFTSDNYAISAEEAAPTQLAYGRVSADNDIHAYNQNAVVDAALAANATAYYKVTIRMWLEGEDKSCNNETYADLKDNWDLDLSFVIGTGAGTLEDPAIVNCIGSVASATITGSDTLTITLATNKLDNGEVAVSYAWKRANGDAAVGTASDNTFTAAYEDEAGTAYYYCLVTTNKGNVYRTPLASLTATAAATIAASGSDLAVTKNITGDATYQWYDVTAGADVDSQTSATLAAANMTAEHTYCCKVTVGGRTYTTNSMVKPA